MGDEILSQEEIDELLNGIDDVTITEHKRRAEQITKEYVHSNEYIESIVVRFKNNIIESEQNRKRIEAYLLEKSSEYSRQQIEEFTNGELITIVETFIK